jgi:hypothetical protein
VNPQAVNRFAYVLNNPIKYTSPTGLYNDDGTNVNAGPIPSPGVLGNAIGRLFELNCTETMKQPISRRHLISTLKGLGLTALIVISIAIVIFVCALLALRPFLAGID